MKKLMGLIYKDIIQMKSSLIINMVLDLLFILISAISIITFNETLNEEIPLDSLDYAVEFIANSIGFMFVIILLPYTLVLNSISIDEKSNFTRFLLSTGCKRQTIINEKVLFGLILSAPGILFSVVIFLILFMMNGNPYITPVLCIAYFVYTVLAMVFLITITILYSTIFSSISNQAIGAVVFMIIAGLLYAGLFLSTLFIGTETINYFLFGVSGALLALSLGAYFASIKVYQHKDF